ncbi:uncharacterized protein A4U43_C03F24610 [Asparagus officinalis]|uniref:Peptidase C1A papain C-terminal domain-containing protein n=1 Tax=Asparagus officinalis TaxID=4686 RepID=A0A5P1FDM6_ASPOF|nr:uncharacterized protein A4U43_C03F24610 [Asparagus officinalis]
MKNAKVITIDGYEDVPENDENALTKAVANQPVSVAIEAGGRGFQLYQSVRLLFPVSVAIEAGGRGFQLYQSDKLKKIETATPSSSSTNVREDALSKVLGKDKPGRLRGMGRGVTISKVSFLQARDKHVLQLKEENSEFRNRIQHLETVVHKLVGNHQAVCDIDLFMLLCAMSFDGIDLY